MNQYSNFPRTDKTSVLWISTLEKISVKHHWQSSQLAWLLSPGWDPSTLTLAVSSHSGKGHSVAYVHSLLPNTTPRSPPTHTKDPGKAKLKQRILPRRVFMRKSCFYYTYCRWLTAKDPQQIIQIFFIDCFIKRNTELQKQRRNEDISSAPRSGEENWERSNGKKMLDPTASQYKRQRYPCIQADSLEKVTRPVRDFTVLSFASHSGLLIVLYGCRESSWK